ncbi:hypothetical protein [Flagellimonas sp. 2504JD4-2]
MKKTLGKPENWQDFESLCKKLWGELLGIPNKIKKNGRMGQPQAGVDVYGRPKEEKLYWGVQAKGKDDYAQAKLSKNEITLEIEKAKSFKPALGVYVIATTQNKDSEIEEFVRLKDEENREKGLFEILLFCWEDIVDLIEENPNTYNWYLNDVGQKGRFDFGVLFNEMQEKLVLKPIFEKKITKYKFSQKSDYQILKDTMEIDFPKISPFLFSSFQSNKVNKSWVSFDLVMENRGSAVIEDWKVEINFVEGVRRLDNGHPFFPKISSTTYIDDENNRITYKPIENQPLIQKDNRYFNVSLLPEPYCNIMILECELLARDYNTTEVIEIEIQPEFFEKIEYKEVNNKFEMREDEIEISYHVVDKED